MATMKIDAINLPQELDKRRKLMASDKDEIRKMIATGMKDTEIARRFGVSRSTIYFIRKPEKRANGGKPRKVNKEAGRKYKAELRERKRKLLEDTQS